MRARVAHWRWRHLRTSQILSAVVYYPLYYHYYHPRSPGHHSSSPPKGLLAAGPSYVIPENGAKDYTEPASCLAMGSEGEGQNCTGNLRAC